MFKDLAKTYLGNADIEFVPQEAETYFQDSTTFELMMMATTNVGLTKDVVTSEFGKRRPLTL